MTKLLVHNGTIVNDGRRFRGYVAAEGEFITAVGEGDAPAALLAGATDIIDADGGLILPGVIDDQVHFRDPGLTHKGDIATESRAAAAGGVTSFMDMPNTKPPTVTMEAVEAKLERAAAVSQTNYAFFIGATNDNLDQLLRADYTRVPGVKLFLGSSTGNMLVDREATLDRIFSEVPALIAIHSEDEATISANMARVRAERGDDLPVELHPQVRSREACVISTRRAIERARRFSTRLHVLHVSTADEVAMFEPDRPEDKRITSEVCVHHLWFSDDDYSRLGTRIKMNPAIKTDADREALRRGLVEGRIDIVATDHAPHLTEEKAGKGTDRLSAASGAPMVQWSLAVMLELADRGCWDYELVVEKMCHAPARLYGVDRRGYLRPGYYADIAVVATGTPYTVTDADAIGRCGWTPLDGTVLHHRVTACRVNGASPGERPLPLRFAR